MVRTPGNVAAAAAVVMLAGYWIAKKHRKAKDAVLIEEDRSPLIVPHPKRPRYRWWRPSVRKAKYTRVRPAPADGGPAD